MKTLIFVLFIAVIASLFIKLAKGGTKAKKEISKEEPADENDNDVCNIRDVVFFKKELLSEPEQTLFHRLKEALPEQIILAQVSMSAIVGIKKSASQQAQLNRINRKYVDYVVCNPDFSTLAVIELDDKTHERYDRWKSDDVKNVAFQKAGIPLIRFKAKHLPGIEEIQSAVKELQHKNQPRESFQD